MLLFMTLWSLVVYFRWHTLRPAGMASNVPIQRVSAVSTQEKFPERESSNQNRWLPAANRVNSQETRMLSPALTLHGPNFGHDVRECVRRQVAGIESALHDSLFPRPLRAVTIVEKDADRLEALEESLRSNRGHVFLEVLVPSLSKERGSVSVSGPLRDTVEVRPTGVYTSQPNAGQPASVFVAMSFDKKMRTVWKYGIEKPVQEAGLNCERMDEMYFAGDILDRMKTLIQRAELVVADITGNNPNVCLELGYAWGLGRTTLLLVLRDETSEHEDLPFDVRTQRCLFYEDAVDLEEKLKAALYGMKLNRR